MAGSVCGYVVRADNETPIQGATIIVSGRASAPDLAPLPDSAGWFVLDGLPPGKWLLRARAPNEETGEAMVPIFNNASTNVTIVVAGSRSPAATPQTGGLEGHVVHARTGLPVENATLTVVRGPGPAPGIAPLTDSAGWFALDGLALGDWVLRAVGPDEETGEASVHVVSGACASVTIAVERPVQDARSSSTSRLAPERAAMTRQSGTVEGHVVRAETGLPLENATVTVVQGSGSAPDIAPVTDSAGWFALDGLPVGHWVLRATGPGGETGEARVRVSTAEVIAITICIGPRRRPEPHNLKTARTRPASPVRAKRGRQKG